MPYQATLEFTDVPAGLHDSDLVAALGDRLVAISRFPGGGLRLVLALPAGSLAEAVATVLSHLFRIPQLPDPRSVEVLSREEVLRRASLVAVEELVSVSEAASLLGITRQAVLRRIVTGSLTARKVGSTYTIARSALPSR